MYAPQTHKNKIIMVRGKNIREKKQVQKNEWENQGGKGLPGQALSLS